MSTVVDVYNLALTNLDLSSVVNSVNDNSAVASACNRWYDWARRKTLERAYWDFATKYPALSMVLDQTTIPDTQIVYPGWRYVYARPVDCLRFLAVTTIFGLRVNPFLSFLWSSNAFWGTTASWGPFNPPYQEALDQIQSPPNNSINILTDQTCAYGVYVTDVTNVGVWSTTFMEAVALQLAVPIAGPLSANQGAKARVKKELEDAITRALAHQFSQRQEDPYPDSPAITARN